MVYSECVVWQVSFTKKAAKQVSKLPEKIQRQAALLAEEIRMMGPVRGNWKNYGKLADGSHHCHLKAGHPTYVACWRVTDREIKFVEVYYVGTHEKAPY